MTNKNTKRMLWVFLFLQILVLLAMFLNFNAHEERGYFLQFSVIFSACGVGWLGGLLAAVSFYK